MQILVSHICIITLNNKILRILQNKTYSALVKELYVHYNTLPVTQLHKMQLLLVHKCYYHKHLLPKIYYDYCQPNQGMYSYETRNKADLYLHSVNTISLFGQRYIKFKGALLWNDLPDYIKNIRSINKFKSKLKSYLQQNYILE